MTGRTKYSDEAFAEVIRLISEGVPLANALGGKDRPGRTAFYERLKSDATLAREYEVAMTQRAQCRVDAILDVNDRLLRGAIDPQSARCISDNLKWLAQKEDPRRFSDVSRTEISGRDGKDLLPEMSDFELARVLAYLVGKGTVKAPCIECGELRALPDPEASHAR